MDPLQRRSNPRNRFYCFARFRPLHMDVGGIEWLCVTRDFSRDGLYFLALEPAICVKMHLLLRFPYLADSGAVHRECLVEVVRMRALFPGRCGVGVKLICRHPPGTLRDIWTVHETSRSKDGVEPHIDLYG